MKYVTLTKVFHQIKVLHYKKWKYRRIKKAEFRLWNCATKIYSVIIQYNSALCQKYIVNVQSIIHSIIFGSALILNSALWQFDLIFHSAEIIYCENMDINQKINTNYALWQIMKVFILHFTAIPNLFFINSEINFTVFGFCTMAKKHKLS